MDRTGRTAARIETPAQPAVTGVVGTVEAGGVPDRHAGEMRPAGIGIADARKNGELPSLEQAAERPQRRVQAKRIVEMDELGSSCFIEPKRLCYVSWGRIESLQPCGPASGRRINSSFSVEAVSRQRAPHAVSIRRSIRR